MEILPQVSIFVKQVPARSRCAPCWGLARSSRGLWRVGCPSAPSPLFTVICICSAKAIGNLGGNAPWKGVRGPRGPTELPLELREAELAFSRHLHILTFHKDLSELAGKQGPGDDSDQLNKGSGIDAQQEHAGHGYQKRT